MMQPHLVRHIEENAAVAYSDRTGKNLPHTHRRPARFPPPARPGSPDVGPSLPPCSSSARTRWRKKGLASKKTDHRRRSRTSDENTVAPTTAMVNVDPAPRFAT